MMIASLSRAMTSMAKTTTKGIKRITSAAATSGEAMAKAEFATARTSVWWDVENCGVPKGCDVHKITLNIRSALMERNYCGSLSIHAYGDTSLISLSVQEALSLTGVSLNHVPPGVKDGSDKKIVVDMLLWALENPPPANIMLISGDGDFSYVLHQLGMKGYNIILVRPENSTSPFLIASAKTILLWRSVVSAGSASKLPKEVKLSKRNVVAAGFASKVPKKGEPSKRCKVAGGSASKVAKQSELNKKSVVAAGSASQVPKQAEPSKKSQRCEICNVSCTSMVAFNSHISSKKHKEKDSQSKTQVTPNTLWCSTCKIHYPTVGTEEHISGRRHKNNLKHKPDHTSLREVV